MRLLPSPIPRPGARRRVGSSPAAGLVLVLALAVVGAACGGPEAPVEAVTPTSGVTTSTTGSTATVPAAAGSPAGPPTTDASDPATTADPTATDAAGAPLPTRPPWLGSRTLPTDDDGWAVAQTTPAELADRRFATVDLLPPPADETYSFTVGPLEGEVLARSTWQDGCPVTVDELRYLTLSFWGFDGRPHTGEMIVNAAVVDDVVSVFRALHEARFPIEEMRITTRAELDAPPIGDGNNTGAFVCRPAVGSNRFSEHAYGLAVDINPFHNPYVKGDLILPELAGVYTDRDDVRPGMIVEGDPVVDAFDAVDWGWGGRWDSLKDYQHFSLTDR